MKSGKFLFAPVLWFLCVFALLATWAIMEPEALVRAFDADGRSPFELATLPFYAAIVPAVWIFCPFAGSRRRRIVLQLMVTIVALMAIVKELDLHYLALEYFYPDFVTGEGLKPGVLVRPDGRPLSGTPFKLRVLTNAAAPLGMKAIIVAYFTLFFGLFAAGFAYLGFGWIKGVFTLDPAAWAFGCFGASGVMVQCADRLPSWLGHRFGLSRGPGVTPLKSLMTAVEEGGEMMIAIFAILTIVLAWRRLKVSRR